jgi:hypothetical protein
MPDCGEASISSGAVHHALSRGDQLEAIFRDGREPELFLAALVQASAKTNWQVHSFCLPPNLTSGRK